MASSTDLEIENQLAMENGSIQFTKELTDVQGSQEDKLAGEAKSCKKRKINVSTNYCSHTVIVQASMPWSRLMQIIRYDKTLRYTG